MSKAQSDLDGGCCGRAVGQTPLCLFWWADRSLPARCLLSTPWPTNLRPPDITKTPERRTTAACGMLSEEVKGQGCCWTCAQMSRNSFTEFSLNSCKFGCKSVSNQLVETAARNGGCWSWRGTWQHCVLTKVNIWTHRTSIAFWCWCLIIITQPALYNDRPSRQKKC